MTHEEYIGDVRSRMLEAVSRLESGEINAFEGIQTVYLLYREAELPEDELFFRLMGLDSETNKYPHGELRNKYSQEYLQRLDAEMLQEMAFYGEDILAVCREVAKKYSYN